MIDRRSLIKQTGAAIAALGAGIAAPSLRAFAATVALPFDNGERPLVKYPQKRPMIGVTSRPPQLETPFSAFNGKVITPNDAFFVRYHLADIPLSVDPGTFSVDDQGQGRQALETLVSRHQKDARCQYCRGQPMLGQQSRILQSSRRRRAIGEWRNGQCAMEGRAAQGRSRRGRRPAWRAPSYIQRHGRTCSRQDSRFHQSARHRSCARRRGHARLFDERR